jgi:hypothetical protein
MKPYTPRKKKSVKLSQKTKLVRIDHRTQIEVSVSIPDDEARERYLTRIQSSQRILRGYKKAQRKEIEIPLGSLEEIALLIDDSSLSKIE